MIINPKDKLRKNLFYNNICLIICVFCIACFATALFFQISSIKSAKYANLQENSTYGPIKITNTNVIYKITAYFSGMNTSTYISGEVLDENQDTLYEFGKDLWHEEGYDSEGHWSESSREMSANLTFSEKGTYYIRFLTEEGSMNNISIKIELLKGSYIAHLQAGTLFFILMLIIFCTTNRVWLGEKLVELKESMEDD